VFTVVLFIDETLIVNKLNSPIDTGKRSLPLNYNTEAQIEEFKHYYNYFSKNDSSQNTVENHRNMNKITFVIVGQT